MANYTPLTDFEAKDSLPSGDPDKLAKGADVQAEFNAISAAITSKANVNNPVFTGTVTFPVGGVDGLSLDGGTF